MIKYKLRSFKGSEHINEKGDGPYMTYMVVDTKTSRIQIRPNIHILKRSLENE